jgi:outer membrane biosynthesis protein TonB
MMIASALILGLASAAWAQEEEDEDQLTPEQAMEMLKDIRGLMEKSEDLLHDSSRGKALETEKELLEKLEREFKNEPEALQKQILEKVKKLTERSEKKQKDAIDKMQELLKKARSQQSQSQQKQQQKQQQPQSQSQKNPNGPAPSPYDPNRTDPPNKFRSKADRTHGWGDLPPAIREAIMNGRRDIDEYPAEFQDVLRRVMKEYGKAGEDR